MRAIAFQAFQNSIDAGEFDDLVDEAITNVDSLPSGWEIERGEKVEAPVKPVAKKAAAKPAATKAPAKTAAKPAAKAAAKPATTRKRPTR